MCKIVRLKIEGWLFLTVMEIEMVAGGKSSALYRTPFRKSLYLRCSIYFNEGTTKLMGEIVNHVYYAEVILGGRCYI